MEKLESDFWKSAVAVCGALGCVMILAAMASGICILIYLIVALSFLMILSADVAVTIYRLDQERK